MSVDRSNGSQFGIFEVQMLPQLAPYTGGRCFTGGETTGKHGDVADFPNSEC